MHFGGETPRLEQFYTAFICLQELVFGAGGDGDAVNVVGIKFVQDEEVLVSAAGGDGELTRLVGVNVT